MRRFAISILLPLLMLLAQQGAAVHEVSHLNPRSAPSGHHDDEPLANDALCLSCLAYAGVASAARPDVFQPLLLSFHHHLAAAVAVPVLAAQTLTPRSRGPPPFP